MTSPATGHASPAHEGEAIEVTIRTATRSSFTLLQRRHRTNNLPDVHALVKGHDND